MVDIKTVRAKIDQCISSNSCKNDQALSELKTEPPSALS
jgi:hypothetical protein